MSLYEEFLQATFRALSESAGSVLAHQVTYEELLKSVHVLQPGTDSSALSAAVTAEQLANSAALLTKQISPVITSRLPIEELVKLSARGLQTFSQNTSCLSPDFCDALSNFSDSLSVSSDRVIASKESLKTITEAVHSLKDYSSTSEEASSNNVSFSLKEFIIGIIWPLIIAIIGMSHNQYLSDKATLDAQYQQISEEAYKEQLFQLEQVRSENEKLAISLLENISHSLENISDSLDEISASLEEIVESDSHLPETVVPVLPT